MLFVEAVIAVLCLGVLALAATQQYFLLSEVAVRILPALCQLTVDPEKSVRDNVFRAIKGYLGKLEKVSEDPTLRESMGKCRRIKYTE
jgi:SCY1-like protein 1